MQCPHCLKEFQWTQKKHLTRYLGGTYSLCGQQLDKGKTPPILVDDPDQVDCRMCLRFHAKRQQKRVP